MPPKTNPLKLNALQLRTLALAQIVASDPQSARKDDASGDVTLLRIPHAHGDHVHVGPYVVSARDASGFGNPAVWVALARKGLVRDAGPGGIVLSAEGVAYETGLGKNFAAASDH
ncbi:MAG: hypothetical protein AB7G39_13595 [Alphaproteobacteria bacterium]